MATVWDFIAGAASYDDLLPDQRVLADEAMVAEAKVEVNDSRCERGSGRRADDRRKSPSNLRTSTHAGHARKPCETREIE